MTTPEKARTNAAKALLRVIQSYEGPFTEEERALHCMDAICYYVSVVYQIPIPKNKTLRDVLDQQKMQDDCLDLTTDLINQIRDVVDQDVTDPAQWYTIIVKVRELVGVTR